MSSFFALRKVQIQFRDLLGEKVKIGHAGTLDPLAEGLLLCGVEQGTKILSEMILSQKSYTAEIFLGKCSETDDDEGEKFDIEQKRNGNDIPEISEIQNLLDTKFSGKIEQTPPMYSALKISGKRACDLARKENSDIQELEAVMQKKTREVEIHQIKILEYTFPKLKIFVECGSGTYIRSLARDIGLELRLGAYLTFLRRDSVGDFLLSDAIQIPEISEKNIQKFLPEHFNLPEIFVSDEEKQRLENGQRIRFFETQQERKKVLICNKNIQPEIIGFGEQDGFLLRPRKIFH